MTRRRSLTNRLWRRHRGGRAYALMPLRAHLLRARIRAMALVRRLREAAEYPDALNHLDDQR